MSVKYQPVLWNRNKYVYDAVLLGGVVVYLLAFIHLAPLLYGGAAPITPNVVRMRAFGTCAFLMLTLILMIGPLARLDPRFLPLLYNRRHFGVLTFFVALAHADAVLGWYFAFSPTDPFVGVLVANTDATSFVGFPFEWLGVAALTILFVMAATSHDFWLSFLSPPVWKTLHMGVYLAYGLLVMHVVLGLLQTETSVFYPLMVAGSLILVIGLHVTAARKERAHDLAVAPPAQEGWIVAGRVAEIGMNRGITVSLPTGERAAVFRYDDRIAAISNVCAHQNGPLGEGRVIDGCVTCPWHGFQYRPEDGCAPPPFTEKIPTYRVRLEGDRVLLDPRSLPPGTPTEPIVLPEGLR
jgi:nitrite reductase/ring-hydroxylating ferredoxin subunit/DMSO/TMAO reductase YedYZ heme-binding membrane subunit